MSAETGVHESVLIGDVDDGRGSATVKVTAPIGRRRSFATIVGPIVVLAIVVALWEYMHRDGMRRFFDKPGFMVPSLSTIVEASFFDSTVRSQMLRGLGWTSYATGVGLLLSIVFGVAIGVLMSQARWIEQSMYPYLVAAQAVPVLAIVPLIAAIFGGGMGSRIFVCVMISIFPIVTNTLFGLVSVDKSQHELFTLMGVSRWTRLRKLQFPAAMPSILTGFRISAGLAVIGVIVGEQFFRGGQKPGIGVVVEQFRQKSRFPQLYGGLMIACGLGIVVFLTFSYLSRRVIGHWHESSSQ